MERDLESYTGHYSWRFSGSVGESIGQAGVRGACRGIGSGLVDGSLYAGGVVQLLASVLWLLLAFGEVSLGSISRIEALVLQRLLLL